MSFWKCIGEFLLFRWLFGSHKHNEAMHNVLYTGTNSDNSDFVDDSDSCLFSGSRRCDNSDSRYANQDYDYSQPYDDFQDEQEDYDFMENDF